MPAVSIPANKAGDYGGHMTYKIQSDLEAMFGVSGVVSALCYPVFQGLSQ